MCCGARGGVLGNCVQTWHKWWLTSLTALVMNLSGFGAIWLIRSARMRTEKVLKDRVMGVLSGPQRGMHVCQAVQWVVVVLWLGGIGVHAHY